MRVEEVEPYVRQVCRERLQLAIQLHCDLRDEDPQLFADLCRESIARAEQSLSGDGTLREMCRTACVSLTGIVADEKRKAQELMDGSLMI